MRPPKCVICGKTSRTSDDQFKLIRFTLTEEQKAHNLKLKEENAVGHPRGTSWFCFEHYEQAKELKNLSNVEAIKIVKAAIIESQESIKPENTMPD